MNGSLLLILTAHIPYLRNAARGIDGEEPLHELIAQALIPTLATLQDLHTAQVPLRVAVAWSPILLEQLADNVVQKHFIGWMEEQLTQIEAAQRDWEQRGETHAAYLAQFYHEQYQNVLETFSNRWRRNLPAVLRELVSAGVVEPLASAATYAYLPLLRQPESLRAQLELGMLAITQRLGVHPQGVWLPECAFHPRMLKQLLLLEPRYLIVDPTSLGPNREDQVWHVAPDHLLAISRDSEVQRHLWSMQTGYGSDPLFRAARVEAQAGLGLWRHGMGTEDEPYDPYHAFQRAREYASHSRNVIADRLAASHQEVLALPLDAALLGVQWFEGPIWLRALLAELAQEPRFTLRTPSDYLQEERSYPITTLREGSWGPGGNHHAWLSPAAEPLWQAIHATEARVASMVDRWPRTSGIRERALTQAVRELLLAQSSTWPLLLGQGIASAEERPREHLRRCDELCHLAERPIDSISEADIERLDLLEELDNAFPGLNYRIFALGSDS